jgi:hypothetical protein
MGNILANNISISSGTNHKDLQTSGAVVNFSSAQSQIRFRNSTANTGNVLWAGDVLIASGSVNSGNITADAVTISGATNSGTITSPTTTLTGLGTNSGQIFGNLRKYPGTTNTGAVSRIIVTSTPADATSVGEAQSLSLGVTATYGPNPAVQLSYKWQKSTTYPWFGYNWVDIPGATTSTLTVNDPSSLNQLYVSCVITTSADPGALYRAISFIDVIQRYNNFVGNETMTGGTTAGIYLPGFAINKSIAGVISLLNTGFYEFTDGLVYRVETYYASVYGDLDGRGYAHTNQYGAGPYINQYVELLTSRVIDGGECGTDSNDHPTDGEAPNFFSELYEGYFFMNGVPFTGELTATRKTRASDSTGTSFWCALTPETRKVFLGVPTDNIPTWSVGEDEKITVYSSVNFANKGLSSLRFQNVKRVEGDFIISGNPLQWGLYRCVTDTITGHFSCSNIAINTLRYITPHVGELSCSGCGLTSLQYAPNVTFTGGAIQIAYNAITSLQYAPTVPVGGYFYASSNQLTSLQYFSYTNGLIVFDCSNNPGLTSLQYGPTNTMVNNYTCNDLPNLTSLQYLPQNVGSLSAQTTGITNIAYMPCSGSFFYLGGKLYPATADQCGVKWVYLNNTRMSELGFVGAYSIGYYSSAGVKDTTYTNPTPQKVLDTRDFYTYSNGTPTKVRDGFLFDGSSIYYAGGKYKVDGDHTTPSTSAANMQALNIADVVFTGELRVQGVFASSLGLPSEIGTLRLGSYNIVSVVGTATIGTLIFQGSGLIPKSEFTKWTFTSISVLQCNLSSIDIPSVTGDVTISDTGINSLALGDVGGTLSVASSLTSPFAVTTGIVFSAIFSQIRITQLAMSECNSLVINTCSYLTGVTVGGATMSYVEIYSAEGLASLSLPNTVTSNLILYNTAIATYANFPCTISAFRNQYPGASNVIAADKCGVYWIYYTGNENPRVLASGASSVGYFSTPGVKNTTYTNSTPQRTIDGNQDLYTYSNGTPTKSSTGTVGGYTVTYNSGQYNITSPVFGTDLNPNVDLSGITVLGDYTIVLQNNVIVSLPIAPLAVTGQVTLTNENSYISPLGFFRTHTVNDLSWAPRTTSNLNINSGPGTTTLISFANCPTVTDTLKISGIIPAFNTFQKSAQVNKLDFVLRDTVTASNYLMSDLPDSVTSLKLTVSNYYVPNPQTISLAGISENVVNLDVAGGVLASNDDAASLPSTMTSLTHRGSRTEIKAFLVSVPCSITNISLPSLTSYENVVASDRCGVWWTYSATGRTHTLSPVPLSYGYIDPVLNGSNTTYTNSTPQKALDTGDFYTYSNGTPTKVRNGLVRFSVQSNDNYVGESFIIGSYSSAKSLYVLDTLGAAVTFRYNGTCDSIANCVVIGNVELRSYAVTRADSTIPLLPYEVVGNVAILASSVSNFTGLTKTISGGLELNGLLYSNYSIDVTSLAANFSTYIGGNLMVGYYNIAVDFGSTAKTILGNISIHALKNNSLIDSHVSSITSTNGKTLTVRSTGKIYVYNNGTYTLTN